MRCDQASSDGATRSIPCGYCGAHHGTICPRIKAIEFHPDGTQKRVEFFAPNDDYGPANHYHTHTTGMRLNSKKDPG